MCIGALTIVADFMGAIGSGTGGLPQPQKVRALQFQGFPLPRLPAHVLALENVPWLPGYQGFGALV
jgi:hypothetical protein